MAPTKEEKPSKKVVPRDQNKNEEFSCPDCDAPLRHVEGCIMCPFCGWSKCG